LWNQKLGHVFIGPHIKENQGMGRFGGPCRNTPAGLFPCMVKHLDTKAWAQEATTVVIEKQPDRNRSMKSIENLLHAYFLIKGKEVVIWDARFKVPDCAGSGKAMYDKRKRRPSREPVNL
jgi:hypothetical protein